MATFTGGAGGSLPEGALLVDASGNLFGTTVAGGANNTGTVFELPKTGNSYSSTPTVLASFGSGVTGVGQGNLVEDAAGDLFGTTTSSVFEVQKTGTGTGYADPVSLVAFPAGTLGSSLTIDAAGDIFGETISGGANNDGTVFEIVNGASTAITLASFSLADGQLNLNDPKTLIVDANGDLFGTTDPSSQNSGGVVFEIVKTAGVYQSTPTIVYNFDGQGQGRLGANLVADASGDLFGTTLTGGANNEGSAFEITDSGYVTPRNSFNNNDSANVVLQNTNGQAAIWELSGTNVIGSGLVGPNPGPGWNVVGTGDFYGNGLSDLLWQNTGGQAAIWEMSGTNVIGSGLVGPNPGPGWNVVGTGDFNDDGHSDILFQNTSGQVAIWELNGTNVIGSAVVGPNPGAGWSAVGTGDFNDDGHSDILFQNTSGQVAIWEMDGTNVIGSAVVGPNPGAGWSAVGTGDFNGDGHSDILFQNTSGQVAIWEMNGTNVIGSGVVGPNPGPSWSAVGTGDYNNDGHSDILFQNTSGQVATWEMNGTNVIGGGVVGPNPGTSWRA